MNIYFSSNGPFLGVWSDAGAAVPCDKQGVMLASRGRVLGKMRRN